MSTPLFDLEPGWTWNPDRWVEPVDATPADLKAAWKAYALKWLRCIECGTPKKLNQGRTGGMVCDDCALIDGCAHRATLAPDEAGPGEHVSHWGTRHTVAAHEAGLRSQAQRRAAYLRSVK